MGNESPFAADIRKYEALLEKDPGSFSFAPLSDVYRRAGMLDEALEVAIKGCEMHPEFLGGFMALGRACFEKGLFPEGRKALEKVVQVMPDNLLAHNLLSQICRRLGDVEAAERSESVVRAQTSAEDALGLSIPAAAAVAEPPDEEDVLELTEVFDMLEVMPEAAAPEPVVEEPVWMGQEPDEYEYLPPAEEPEETTSEAASAGSPISTATIAELYVSQGFNDRALGIYRELLAADPGNEELKRRIAQLSAPVEAPAGELIFESPAELEVAGSEYQPAVITPSGQDAVLATLEEMLENIRRRR